MSKLTIILNSFKNPATRKLVILLGLGDLAAIVGVILSIVFRSVPGFVLTGSVYALVYFVASHYVKIRLAFPVESEEIDEEL
jgi:hypothetical protein